MPVTITITDPTAPEARALQAYLSALHGTTGAVQVPEVHKTADDITQWRSWATVTDEEVKTLGLTATPVRESDDGPSASDAGAPDFDSAGFPHDPRIHASSRATVADGTWRKKRGVSDDMVGAVEAELTARIESIRSNMVAPGPIIIGGDDAPEVPEVPVPESVDGAKEADGTISETTAPDVPDFPQVTLSAPPAPPVDQPNPFLAVMSRIGKSKLDKAKKDELLTAAGALDDKGNPSILVLNKKPELIEGFVALLDSEGV